MVVEGDGNAAVAEVRQDRQGILQAVMSEAVGVVAEEHGGYQAGTIGVGQGFT